MSDPVALTFVGAAVYWILGLPAALLFPPFLIPFPSLTYSISSVKITLSQNIMIITIMS